ncbi:nuclear transport factor 2 family protein [Cytophagaceae bacterium DM2B3-1]|uniref:Nuclear transport factor 2 family protein n=1 Tax=Xanthocytophaga flava TaxID=3048013 RepID=A0ABT7CH61_9BACT|nr:nuclear transport factor 2 family protein [Xanthocytophaga flavus]MDJ1472377.1 nuclear transport factor 2 family protein [Xanthocytophaga flavus]MDJ1493076.1 nuclear transport factor 2 family protein [Xanthocytophaga flavus]
MQTDLQAIVSTFLTVLENRKSSDELEPFYHPDAIQIEYPNTLTKNLTKRNLQELKAASDRGLNVLQKEKYEVLHSYVYGNTVIIEVIWTGVLNIPLASIPVGGEMKAYFAQFFEFMDGKIIRQRNYDCFEPFGA